eukprot:gene21185-25450_t
MKWYRSHAPGDKKLPATVVFAGLIGLAHLVVLWVGLPLLHFSGVETMELPTAAQWGYMLLNGAIAVVVNCLMFCVIVVMSPLFLSTGMTLSIPITFAFDLMLWDKDQGHYPALLSGVALATLGPIVLAAADKVHNAHFLRRMD